MNYFEGEVRHVPESRCVEMFPVAPSIACRSGPGSWRSGSFFCASLLTAGSALCDLLVDGAELGVAVRVLLAFQGPGRA
ncbi:hypothetical protein [Streptomyces sp. NPDC002922]|uniref:hypothetical protein n=1 Tax=Streptomyces sp. NPDC002922 TaxID=3154439 RepID=UPI0033B6A22F